MRDNTGRTGTLLFGTMMSIQRGYMDLVEQTISRSIEAMTDQSRAALHAAVQQTQASVDYFQESRTSIDAVVKQSQASLDYLKESRPALDAVLQQARAGLNFFRETQTSFGTLMQPMQHQAHRVGETIDRAQETIRNERDRAEESLRGERDRDTRLAQEAVRGEQDRDTRRRGNGQEQQVSAREPQQRDPQTRDRDQSRDQQRTAM